MVIKFVFWCILLLLLSGCSGTGAETETKAPSTGLLLSSSGGIPAVMFDHSTHSSHGCTACHQCGVGDGKISFMSKDWAHITCKTCHSDTQQGPVSCKGCHIVTAVSAKSVAAATVLVAQSGSAEFVVSGEGMDGIAGIQMDISYDAAAFSAPTVTGGSLIAGAMLAANTSIPGIIRIAVISTKSFVGSGQIVAVSFASKASSEGSVYIRAIDTINTLGVPQSVAVEITSLNGTVLVPVASASTPFSTTPGVAVIPGVPTSAAPTSTFACKQPR